MKTARNSQSYIALSFPEIYLSRNLKSVFAERIVQLKLNFSYINNAGPSVAVDQRENWHIEFPKVGFIQMRFREDHANSLSSECWPDPNSSTFLLFASSRILVVSRQ